jgi:hypothetical protein
MLTESKRYNYQIIHQGVTYDLTTDPRGWDKQAIGFERDDSFGINTQFTIPLEFAKDGYDRHLTIFDGAGFSSQANLNILKKLNDWTTEQFYLCTFDYTKAKYDRDIFTVEAHETGIYKEIQARKGQEYTIEMPEDDKVLVRFNGVSTNRANEVIGTIASPAGEQDLEHKIASGIDHYYPIYGNRTIREYTDNLIFTNTDDTPYAWVLAKATKSCTIEAEVVVHLDTFDDLPAIGTEFPPPCVIKLVKFVSSGETWSISSIVDTWEPIAVQQEGGSLKTKKTKCFFDSASRSYSISMAKGEHLALFYVAPYGSPVPSGINPHIRNCDGTVMKIVDLSTSGINYSGLEAVTHEWLIDKLLTEILGAGNYTLTFDYTALGYTPLLVPTDSIRRSDGKKIIAKLEDVLKSLYIIANIGVKIWETNIKICDLADCYPQSTSPRVLNLFKDIKLLVDEKHLYNSVQVGWNAESNDKENGVFEVLAKNDFQIIGDNIKDKKLELVHPFIGSPYSIENYIKETRNAKTVDNKSDNRLMILACKAVEEKEEGDFQSWFYSMSSGRILSPGQIAFGFLGTYFDSSYMVRSGAGIIVKKDATYNFIIKYVGSDYRNRIVYNMAQIRFFVNDVLVTESICNLTVTYIGTTVNIKTAKDHVFPIYLKAGDVVRIVTYLKGTAEGETLTVVLPNNYHRTIVMVDSITTNYYELYRDHTITKGAFSWATMYNLPMSPARILRKHLNYISVSTWRNVHDIEFTAAERDADVITKMDYETTAITENADITPTTPLFLPMVIDVKTSLGFNSLMDIIGESSYILFNFTDSKFGLLSGWINKIAIKAGKEEEQQFEFQANTI